MRKSNLVTSGSTLYAGGDSPTISLAAFDLPGDMNCDGKVSGVDIAPFILALIAPNAFAEVYPCCSINSADMNLSGTPDPNDLPAFVAALLGP